MDYWLSKFMYDLGNASVLKQFRESPNPLLNGIPSSRRSGSRACRRHSIPPAAGERVSRGHLTKRIL
jgi:hypothetical protein